MYQRILVGLDGSGNALRAATEAADLAKQHEAELHLVTVTRPYKVSPELHRFLQAENLLGEPKYVLDEMTSAIISEAEDMARRVGVKSIKTAIREGKPARTLVDYAKAKHCDLIVVGSRGVGEMEAMLLGSVSQKVALLSSCSVLIVR